MARATGTLPRRAVHAGSRGEHAYERIREAIQDRRLAPTHRVREEEIAAWLGISRTPVRDALKRLERDGLLTTAGRRGLVVAELDQQQLAELYALRDVLEGLAARLAAQHATDTEVAAMRELLARLARTAAADVSGMVRTSRLFHQAMYRAARNRFLVAALESLETSLALLPDSAYAGRTIARVSLRQHVGIVDAIAARRPSLAERRAREHVGTGAKHRMRIVLDNDVESFRRISILGRGAGVTGSRSRVAGSTRTGGAHRGLVPRSSSRRALSSAG